MERLHSASDSMISYIQNYAKTHVKRKKEQYSIPQLSEIEVIQKKILELENKIMEYEKRRAENLCKVLEVLSPENKAIKIIPIYKKLKVAQ